MPIARVRSVAEAREALSGGPSPVVVVPVHDAYDDAVQCVLSLVRHTPPDCEIVVIDDGSRDARVRGIPDLLRAPSQRVVFWERDENVGFVRTMNDAFDATDRHDVVLVNSDVIVGPEWLERLREAAYADSRIATATPLSNHGTILSVPYRNRPSALPVDATPEESARAVAAGSGKLRPQLPTSIGHCTYFKRMALDVVGGFDPAFSPGYGEEVDFSMRCTLAGLAHVCADDVFVFHRGGASFGRSPAADALRAGHEAMIAERYPFYHSWVATAASSEIQPLARALAHARRALLGPTIAIDATCLGPYLTGTQRATIEIARALARHPRSGRILVVLPGESPPYLAGAFAGCDKIELVRAGNVAPERRADVAFRPVQMFTGQEFTMLQSLGSRIVVNQLDFIAFNNPGYFPHAGVWTVYRDMTRLALAVVDGVTFISRYSEKEAHEEGLIPPGRPTKVISLGVDHSFAAPAAVRPARLPATVREKGFMLCLGTDFRHKNRLFALRTFAAMRARGWDGHLVLAGPRLEWGSSRAAEAEWAMRHPEVAAHVTTLAQVPDSERAWLLEHAGLVINPTLYEGFGLVPFEAAAAGTPCLSSALAALEEVLPPGLEVIAEWRPETVAGQALALLEDEARRRRIVEDLRHRARDFTWDTVAGRLLDFFDVVCRARPAPAVTAVQGEGGVIGTTSPPMPFANGAGKLGIEEMYPAEFNEALRAIGQRPMLRKPIAGVAAFAYRFASRVRSTIVKGSDVGPDADDDPGRP